MHFLSARVRKKTTNTFSGKCRLVFFFQKVLQVLSLCFILSIDWRGCGDTHKGCMTGVGVATLTKVVVSD